MDTLVPFGLQNLVPEDHVAAHLHAARLSHLPAVKVATVSQLTVLPNVPEIKHESSWKTILLMSIVCLVTAAILVWYFRKHILTCVRSLVCVHPPKDHGSIEMSTNPEEIGTDPGFDELDLTCQ
jgi:protein-S-isoprenylcysteine O-methyltransferase Ste14